MCQTKSVPQLLGDLPSGQIATHEFALTHTTSRTLHLDIANSLSMDTCTNTIERFLSQYGDITCTLHLENEQTFVAWIILFVTRIQPSTSKNINDTTDLNEFLGISIPL